MKDMKYKILQQNNCISPRQDEIQGIKILKDQQYRRSLDKGVLLLLISLKPKYNFLQEEINVFRQNDIDVIIGQIENRIKYRQNQLHNDLNNDLKNSGLRINTEPTDQPYRSTDQYEQKLDESNINFNQSLDKKKQMLRSERLQNKKKSQQNSNNHSLLHTPQLEQEDLLNLKNQLFDLIFDIIDLNQALESCKDIVQFYSYENDSDSNKHKKQYSLKEQINNQLKKDNSDIKGSPPNFNNKVNEYQTPTQHKQKITSQSNSFIYSKEFNVNEKNNNVQILSSFLSKNTKQLNQSSQKIDQKYNPILKDKKSFFIQPKDLSSSKQYQKQSSKSNYQQIQKQNVIKRQRSNSNLKNKKQNIINEYQIMKNQQTATHQTYKQTIQNSLLKEKSKNQDKMKPPLYNTLMNDMQQVKNISFINNIKTEESNDDDLVNMLPPKDILQTEEELIKSNDERSFSQSFTNNNLKGPKIENQIQYPQNQGDQTIISTNSGWVNKGNVQEYSSLYQQLNQQNEKKVGFIKQNNNLFQKQDKNQFHLRLKSKEYFEMKKNESNRIISSKFR